jgi:hypothetical protein
MNRARTRTAAGPRSQRILGDVQVLEGLHLNSRRCNLRNPFPKPREPWRGSTPLTGPSRRARLRFGPSRAATGWLLVSLGSAQGY